jgi:hypothetical protein
MFDVSEDVFSETDVLEMATHQATMLAKQATLPINLEMGCAPIQ